jgi:hypothetical protein
MHWLEHRSVTGPLHRLVETLEVEAAVGEETVTWRVEILQDVDDMTCFRYRAWDLELFRLRPSFPRDPGGEPAHESDDQLFVSRPLPRERTSAASFHAESLEVAREIVLADVLASLEHITAVARED